MSEIGTFKAKNTLGSPLDRVEHDEETAIPRRGRPVARPVPADRGAQAAAGRIIARSKGVRLGGIGLKEWIDEGRP